MSWKISEKRKIQALQEFSVTEFDSGWQSLYAMNFINSPKERAALFQHAMEEFFHADLFDGLCKQLSKQPLNLPVVGRNIIMDEKNHADKVIDFFCYMYVGEQSVNEDFEHYTKANIEPKIKNTFIKIQKDEVFHETDSLESLNTVADGNKWKLKKYLFLNRFKRAYRQLSVFSSRLGEFSLSITLSGCYFVFGLFFAPMLKKRLSLSRKDQLNLLTRQTNIFKEGIK